MSWRRGRVLALAAAVAGLASGCSDGGGGNGREVSAGTLGTRPEAAVESAPAGTASAGPRPGDGNGATADEVDLCGLLEPATLADLGGEGPGTPGPGPDRCTWGPVELELRRPGAGGGLDGLRQWQDEVAPVAAIEGLGQGAVRAVAADQRGVVAVAGADVLLVLLAPASGDALEAAAREAWERL